MCYAELKLSDIQTFPWDICEWIYLSFVIRCHLGPFNDCFNLWFSSYIARNLSLIYNTFIVSKRLNSSYKISWRQWSFFISKMYTVIDSIGPFTKTIPAWISNYIQSDVWHGITFPFPNFNDGIIEVWKWIYYFAPHFIMDVITYQF